MGVVLNTGRDGPLTCVAADVDPQRAVAGELLSAVGADRSA